MLSRPQSRYIEIQIILMHIAGWVGLLVPATRHIALWLTPFHLVTTALLVWFYADGERSGGQNVALIAIALAGFAIECLGVHTGFPFGRYEYGTVLGYRLWAVPLIIGTNWYFLTVSFYSVVSSWVARPWVRYILVGLGMMLLDILIEPVAIKLGFWHWYGQPVPLQNYIAWWVAGALMAALYAQVAQPTRHPLAKTLLCCQVLFFVGVYFWG